MALRDNINKAYADQQKLRNAAPSQGISPLTERRANNNRNADSLKMAGTQQAQQGAMSQLAKDPQAVQTGALAQQQQAAAQQRGLQEQQFQPQADTGVKSIEEFQSEAIEKAQENVNAEAQKLNQKFAVYGSLGSRIGNAVMEEMAAGVDITEQFKVDAEILDKTATDVAAEGVDSQAVKDSINTVLGFVQEGTPEAFQNAIDQLINDKDLYNKEEGSSPEAQIEQILNSLNISSAAQKQIITSGLAEGTLDPDQMNIGTLIKNDLFTLEDLGLTEKQIKEDLGEDWETLTIEQITDRIEDKYKEQIKEKDDILKELSNPNISEDRRKELNQELKLLDASGISSAFEASGRSIERLAQADQIAIGGQLQSIEEVLSDENIKNKSDELLTRLAAADPEEAQSIIDQWKKENPGYEGMGDWIGQQQTEMTAKTENVKTVNELINQKAEQEAEFISLENEIFEDVDAQTKEDVTKLFQALGFTTEGMGILGNASNADAQATYTKIQDYIKKDNTHKGLWKDFLTNVKNVKVEDLKGMDVNNIEDLIDFVGGTNGEDFSYIANLDDFLGGLDVDKESQNPEKFFKRLFGGVNDTFDMENFNNMFTQIKTINDFQDTGAIKNLYGFEVEKISNSFLDIFDSDKDGKVDNISDIVTELKKKIGNGIDVKNALDENGNPTAEYKELQTLMSFMDGSFEIEMKDAIDKAKDDWDKKVRDGITQRKTDAETFLDKAPDWMEGLEQYSYDRDKPEGRKAYISSLYSKHPSRNSWKKTFDAGPLGPGTAQKQGARIFAAMTIRPKRLWENMPDWNTNNFPSKELIAYISRNIGLDPYGQNGDTGADQVASMLRNLASPITKRDGSYDGKQRGKGRIYNPTKDEVIKGVEKLFGKSVKEANDIQWNYREAMQDKDLEDAGPNPFDIS